MVIPLTPHQNYLRKIGTPTPPSSRAWRPFKASTQSMDVPLFSKVKVAGMIKTFVVLVVLVILFLLHLHLQSSPSSSSSSSSSPAPLTLFVGSNSGLFPWNPWQPTRHNSGSQKTSSSRWSTLTVAQKSDRTGKKIGTPPTIYIKLKHDDVGNDEWPRFQKIRLHLQTCFFHLARTYTHSYMRHMHHNHISYTSIHTPAIPVIWWTKNLEPELGSVPAAKKLWWMGSASGNISSPTAICRRFFSKSLQTTKLGTKATSNVVIFLGGWHDFSRPFASAERSPWNHIPLRFLGHPELNRRPLQQTSVP